MDFLNSIYAKVVVENERNIRFWEQYLKSLQDLDFSLFSEHLTVPVMVPVGSRILFRGDLKHTNEITIAMGADYFAKCSLQQAEILRQHRMKDAQSKLELYIKEREYLQNQMSFSKQNIYDSVGQEIVEEYSEEEDRIWREKHKQNMKQYKMQSRKSDRIENTITDENLWNKLEELELQEELELELAHMKNKVTNENNVEHSKKDTFKDNSMIREKYQSLILDPGELTLSSNIKSKDDIVPFNCSNPASISKIDLLQQVIERQNELGEKLQQIKQKGKNRSVTELDLISKLDEMEQLDELEDEMERLDDIILSENVENIEDLEEKASSQPIKRSVMFADEDDSETIEITFKHSDVLPYNVSYDPEKGIQKPSDIYAVFEKQFSEEITSILKKKKYEWDELLEETSKLDAPINVNQYVEHKIHTDKTIVIKDIIERVDRNANMIGSTDARPTSLFKKKRLQSKS